MKPQMLSHSDSDQNYLPRKNPFMFLSKLKQILAEITKDLLPSTEPKVFIIRNKSGETYWKIDDPLTGKQTYIGSEEEARIWLDRRFYR